MDQLKPKRGSQTDPKTGVMKCDDVAVVLKPHWGIPLRHRTSLCLFMSSAFGIVCLAGAALIPDINYWNAGLAWLSATVFIHNRYLVQLSIVALAQADAVAAEFGLSGPTTVGPVEASVTAMFQRSCWQNEPTPRRRTGSIWCSVPRLRRSTARFS